MTRILGSLEQIAKLAFLIAAAGFVSLLAHHNYLGIPMWLARPPEVYLSEAYLFVVVLAVTMTGILAVSIVPASILFLSMWMFMRRRPNLKSFPSTIANRVMVPGLAVVIVGTLSLFLLSRIGERSDVVVGLLALEDLGARPGWVFATAAGTSTAGLAISAIVLRQFELVTAAHLMWRALFTISTLLAVFLPVIFGSTARPLFYPVAEIRLRDAPPECGLLILHDEGRTMLWQAEQHRGRITIYSANRIAAVQVGELRDIRALAVFAATLGDARPRCHAPRGTAAEATDINAAPAPRPPTASQSR